VCVVYKLGKLRIAKLKSHGITTDDCVRHNMFYQEYLWSVSPTHTRIGARSGL
jgi:hypothetical protein